MNIWKNLITINNLPKSIYIGTDCSGIEAPLYTLNMLNISFIHLFSSENDNKCLEYIKNNYKPKYLYKSIFEKNYSLLKKFDLDIYICGFPCQSFSIAGKKLGLNDERGNIFYECLKTIKLLKPKVFILENVKNLKSHDKGNTFNIIMMELNNLQHYYIYYDILNTKDYGIPQNRPRIYIIGILKNIKHSNHYLFPSPIHLNIESNNLFELFLEDIQQESQLTLNQSRILNQRMINKLLDDNYIVNVGVSVNGNFGSAMLNICPCLLASHRYYYLTKYKRFLTKKEWSHFQGFNVNNYVFSFKQIGNSMSVNVLAFIFMSIFNLISFH